MKFSTFFSILPIINAQEIFNNNKHNTSLTSSDNVNQISYNTTYNTTNGNKQYDYYLDELANNILSRISEAKIQYEYNETHCKTMDQHYPYIDIKSHYYPLRSFVAPSESSITKYDMMTEQKYKYNNFDASTEDTKFSYTSGRVLKPVYNKYAHGNFKVFGYYTDWSQYDGRYEGLYDDAQCGRGVDLMSVDPYAYDKIVLGFLGIVGDTGEKKEIIKRAAQDFQRKDNMPTFTDSWGDVLSYRNCGFDHWVTNNVMEMFHQAKAQGVLGGLRKLHHQNPDLKLSVSIGGWTMSSAFHDMVSNNTSRSIFSKGVIDIYKRFSMLNELDIDWEYPGVEGNPSNPYGPEDAKNYAQLIKELKSEFKSIRREDVKISIAVPATLDKLEKMNVPEMLKAGVDYINLMTYDFFGTPWAKELAHHTNLYDNGNSEFSIDNVVQHLTDLNITMKNVFLGYAAYSRNAKNAEITSFSPLKGQYDPGVSKTIGTFESGATEWYDILNNYLDLEKQQGKNQFNLYTDYHANADYLYNPNTKVFMSIDTPRTVYEKAQYVAKHGLGGLFTWTIDLDAGLLVNAAREGLGLKIQNKTIDMQPFYFYGINSNDTNKVPQIKISYDVLANSSVKIIADKAYDMDNKTLTYKWILPNNLSTNDHLNESNIVVKILEGFNPETANITLDVSNGDISTHNEITLSGLHYDSIYP